ncbi:heterokaryon incompatibility protein-domain-containing protein, partial [Neurospora tetraspora]
MNIKLKKPLSYVELLNYCDHTRVDTSNKSPPPTPYVRKFEFSTEEAGVSPKFDLIPLDEDLSGLGNKSLTWSGQVIPPEYRVAMIKTWLSKCRNEHGYKCGHTLPTEYEDYTLLVLDVQRGCLTKIRPSRSHYFALSYVWGREATFQTLKQNFDHLRQPGSISYSSSMLPKTIRDAIKLLIALNERYLWCDRLCIVQDDAENKHSSISRMNAIFGSAHAVIMARSGFDADAGLLSPDHQHPWRRVSRLSDSMRFVTVPSSKAEEGAGLAPLE